MVDATYHRKQPRARQHSVDCSYEQYGDPVGMAKAAFSNALF
jgi:hypothetical protein